MEVRCESVPDSSYDHVVSFGAIGMYLKKEEMAAAVKEAARIVKPGGSLVFTHFLEPRGFFKGTIIDRVEKSFWEAELEAIGLENVRIYDMKHQGDRYQFSCNKVK